jgi:hypothetical protein
VKQYFLFILCGFALLFGCSVVKEKPHILENGLSIKDKTILSFLRTTELKYIEIQASDLTEAMNILNKHIVKECGYPSGVSYVVQPQQIEVHSSDPFDSSVKSIHDIGHSVSIKVNSASLENVIMLIASQSGYKVKLSNGIIFY